MATFVNLALRAGRSAYAEANQAGQAVASARASIARLLGVSDSRRLAFALNCTDALNLAIHGLLRDGDHVVTTVVEHNSILRPLRALEAAGKITVDRLPCNDEGVVEPDTIRAAVSAKRTRLVAMVHASNVTGAIQPVREIARIAHEHEALMLLDAAQSLGELPVRVPDLECDLLAAPGHKGLLGPLGTGFLYLAEGIEQQLASVRQGGTGTQSDEDRQPDALPYKFEAGSLNVPGIVGLGAGADFLAVKGIEKARRHTMELLSQLLMGLKELPGVRVFGPRSVEGRVGVVSITPSSFDPQEAAAMLDAVHRVQVRAGLHCAPLMHRTLGTAAGGGTLRLSIGFFTTADDIARALAALTDLISHAA